MVRSSRTACRDLRRPCGASLSDHSERQPSQSAARRREPCEGAAFGGPQVYGDQRGNERPGLPGNVYRDQFLPAQRILLNLDAIEAQSARCSRKRPCKPESSCKDAARLASGHCRVRGSRSRTRRSLGTLVERIVATYPTDDVAHARACLQANGGVDGAVPQLLRRRGEDGAIAEGQVFGSKAWVLCSISAGIPHVTPSSTSRMNADAPLSSGERARRQPRHGWIAPA